MTLLKSHICKPRVSKCSYETHTMRTQVKQAKSYRNTMAPHPKWSASSSHRFDCKPNGRSPLEKFVPSTGPNKFSYGYFWVGVGSQIPGPVPSGLVCFGNPKTIAFYTRRLKGDRVTLEVQEKSPWKTPWQKRNFFAVSFFFHFDNFFKFSTKNHTQLLLMYLYKNALPTEIKP